MIRAYAVLRTVSAVSLLFAASGCGVHFEQLPAGSVVGRVRLYDYSPSVMRVGNVLKFWWCGQDVNPSDLTQFSDAIEYESIDLTTNQRVGPFAVLGESQYGWDSVFTCNPRVVQGTFANPLGNGQTYTYAMYYVGFGTSGNNRVGVAFSNDGLSWKKYPNPIITSPDADGYGIGQPAVSNLDRNANILMFYEDNQPELYHVEAISTDGVHFTKLGTVTTKGMDPINPNPSWGDMAYDPTTGYWYAAFQRPVRDPGTTGGVVERGQYGTDLYRIPDNALTTGSTPWEKLTSIDTNLTGYESNFLPGFARDPYGYLNVGAYPSIQLYMSIPNPIPPWNASPATAGISGGLSFWDIGTATWVPNQPLRTLNRYFNQTTHESTTGYIDATGGFTLQKTLGHLYESPQQGATLALYGCKNGSTDYFVSVDQLCNGGRILGTQGYGYAQPVAGLNLVPLYLCSTSTDHYLSNDPGCEANLPGALLGYGMP